MQKINKWTKFNNYATIIKMSGELDITTGHNNPFGEYRLGELGEIDLWREHAVLTEYDRLTGGNITQHGELTCQVLEDFLGTGLGQHAYSAAMLHKVALAVDDSRYKSIASGLLRSYAEMLPGDEWERISRFLSDLRPIVDFVDKKRREANELLPLKSLRSARKGQPSERQKSRLGRVNAETMDDFLCGVNIESANIMAAGTLATLMRPELVEDEEYYRVLREADVVYGQITDFSSKDAFTMALRNNKKRFVDSYPRHEWVYDDVGKYIAGFGGRDDFARYVNGLLGRMFGVDNLHEHSIRGNTAHGIVYGTAAVQTALGGIARVIYRKKSEEGGADKVMRTAERLGIKLKRGDGIPSEILPPDVLGMTYVDKTLDGLAAVYTVALGSIARDSKLLAGIDPTKQSPHSLDGSPAFINDFFSAFTGHDLVQGVGITAKPNTRGFDALRTLVRYKVATWSGPLVLPTDVHFQTEAGRVAARTGPANHNVYDLDKSRKHRTPDTPAIQVNTDALGRLEIRAKHMGSGVFVADSYARSEYWRGRIAAADKVALFQSA